MSYVFVFFALSALIALHEMGHLLAAKWAGIPVERFSIGFGRKLWGFRIGETEYRISIIPCGGYVLLGIADENALEALPLRKRLLYAIGGPGGNIVGAFICILIVGIATSGISWESVFVAPARQTWGTAVEICHVIPVLFSHPNQLSGVLGIVAVGGKHVGTNGLRLLELCFMLNLNLAIINLLPIPPLDGGKILMDVLQKIYRPLKRLQMPLALTGWVLLIGLMIYVTIQDAAKIAQGTYA